MNDNIYYLFPTEYKLRIIYFHFQSVPIFFFRLHFGHTSRLYICTDFRRIERWLGKSNHELKKTNMKLIQRSLGKG
jgi:hypothetical protein